MHFIRVTPTSAELDPRPRQTTSASQMRVAAINLQSTLVWEEPVVEKMKCCMHYQHMHRRSCSSHPSSTCSLESDKIIARITTRQRSKPSLKSP
eukprot:6211269-Pleurochrysis_carterae.AAC.4